MSGHRHSVPGVDSLRNVISLRVARSDADLEQCRQVRLAVSPGERAAAVAEMREMEHPGRFAARFGFAEVDRQVEQLRAVGAEPAPVIPPGVQIVSIAERPELWRQAYYRLHETFGDMAFTATLAWAAGHAVTEIQTWTQRGNEAMRSLNERLGHTYGVVSVRVEAPLPLVQA